MAAPLVRKILNLFLASPSDVADERAAAEEIIIDCNKIFGRLLGWQIDLHKWEDTLPGFGRPQAKINPEVDSCHLFIGLLWERWGQPTGDYSSGFEEEFERARTRRKASGEPEIWLVFKKLDPDRLKDPGAQLTKVLAFRKTQVALGEVLFRDVADINDWRSKLQIWLMEYILTLSSSAAVASAGMPTATPPIESSPDTDAKLPDSRGSSKTKGLDQLQKLSVLLSEVVTAGELEFSSVNENRLHEFDVARLYLLSWTWMSVRHTADVLGAHEINLLYKHREELEAAFGEKLEILRAMVADSADVKPGWFWFQDIENKGLLAIFVHLATRDRNSEVRARALKLLRSAKFVLPKETWSELPLNDEDAKVRFETYRYLGELGNPDAISFLQDIASDQENAIYSFAAQQAALNGKIQINPNQAMLDLIENPNLSADDVIRKLKDSIIKVSDEVLLKAMGTSNDPIRLLSVEELARRSSLTKEMAQTLTNDSSITIRILAFDVLAKMGEQIELEQLNKLVSGAEVGLSGNTVALDWVISRILSAYPTEKLEEMVDWYSANGAIAYGALAQKNFERISGDLHSDIENGFVRIKNTSVDRLNKSYGAQAQELLLKAFEKQNLDTFVASRFLAEALEVLAANAVPSDIHLARKYLLPDKPDLSLPALAIVSRFGDEQDVTSLLQLAKNGYEPIGVRAAITALQLTATPLQVARELVATNQPKIIAVAFRWLLGHASDEATHFCCELLEKNEVDNRVRSLFYLSQILDKQQLEQLLADYLARDTYYYNVVCWLDRIVYSTSPFREMFISWLQEKS